jgi:hypothetical protein
MDIVRAIAGVLVNLSGYDKHRQIMKEMDAVKRLLDALEFANNILTEYIFKTFYNLR